MSQIRYLFDEDIPVPIINALSQEEAAIFSCQVGVDSRLHKGTKDPDLLIFAEQNVLTLVSRDRSTRNGHLADHWDVGRHTWGTIMIRKNSTINESWNG